MRRRVLGAAALLAGTIPLLVTPSRAHSANDRVFAPTQIVDHSSANSTGEPSINVAPDGTIYIVAPDGAGVRVPTALPGGGQGVGGSLLWRSEDHGKSWKFLGSYDVPTGGGDSDIVTAPDGTIYASGLSYAACSTVSVSHDKGETFVPDPIAGCGQTPLSNDRQWNAVDGQHTVYTVIGDTMKTQIDLVRSLVTSPLVVPSKTLQLSVTPDYEWPGTVAVDQRNGTTYTVWNTRGAPDDCDDNKCTVPASWKTPDRVLISVLPRGSTTPPAPVVVASRRFDTFDSFVVDAIDAVGTVYVVWSERHSASKETWTMLSSSHDAGKHWSAPVKVNSGPVTTTFPWVTAGDPGRIAVSYYGTSARAASPQKVTAKQSWQVYSAFSIDGGKTFTEYRTTGGMNNGQICTSGTGCTAGGRNLLDFFETAADANGCLVTTYTDNSSGTPYISFVRQVGGPGLRAAKDCARPASFSPPRSTSGAPTRQPATGPGLASTGWPRWVPTLGAVLVVLGAVAGTRRRRSIRSAPLVE
jgi:hypothetical protein